MAGDTPLVIVGNLTADPELRFTPGGDAVANFTVASTPRTFDRQSNEWRDGDTLFMRCSIWKEAAENVAESLTKGARVIVTGRLVQRSWETPEGDKRTVMEMQADEVGPSLRWAQATVTRVDNNQRGGKPWPQQQAQPPRQAPAQQQTRQAPPQQRQQPQADSWAGTRGSGYDEPPPF